MNLFEMMKLTSTFRRYIPAIPHFSTSTSIVLIVCQKSSNHAIGQHRRLDHMFDVQSGSFLGIYKLKSKELKLVKGLNFHGRQQIFSERRLHDQLTFRDPQRFEGQ